MTVRQEIRFNAWRGGAGGLAVLVAAGLMPATGRAQSTLDVSARTLAFSAVAAGDAPASQYVAITSAVTERIDYTIEVEGAGQAAPGWLVIQSRRGTTPARLQIAIDQKGLYAGEYAARAVVRSGADRIPLDITLSVVERPPALRIAPDSLTFRFGVADPAEQLLFVTNAGSGPLSYRASIGQGGEWLTVSPQSGTAQPNQPGLVRIGVQPSKAKPADYGVVRIQAGEETVEVPVIALRGAPGPVLGLNATGFKFEARQGEGHSNLRNIQVLNLEDAALDYQAEVLRGGDWLVLTGARGRVEVGAFGRLGLNAEPGELAPGAYYALVRVSAPGAANSPQYISSVLNVKSAEESPIPDPSPQGLFFTGATDEPAPQAQPIRVFVSSRDPVAFQASANTADGGDWLRVEPRSGVTSTGSVAELRVTVNPAVLKAGVYTGDVTLALADRTIRTTNITFVARPEAAPAAAAKGQRAAGACKPTRLSLTHTGLVNSFATPAGWPSLLIVRLADDCGDPVLNAGVVATFSSNDPSLTMRMTNPQVGLYSATWSPRFEGRVAVAATAGAPGLGTTRAEILGGVTESQEPPQVFAGSIRSIFDPDPGAPLAPGMPVQVFGADFSSGTDAAASIPLPSSLLGTSMLIGANAAPLFFVSPEQLNAQIPPELAADREYATVVLSGNRYSAVDTLILTAARPALVATTGGAVAQHPDSSPVSDQAPARVGEEIILYASGLGPTDPVVAGGAVPASGTPARTRSVPRVTIGGQAAEVLEAALSPDIVGVYRVRVRVPAAVSPGRQMVEIEQQGVVGNRAAVMVGPRE